MTCLLHVLELMEQYLTPHDACKLACVSKSMQEALIPIEEGVFRKHKNIKLLNECVCNSHGSLLCTHVNPGGKMTKNLSVPMPLGASSKCKLRELEAYKRLWGNIPITCKIELKPEHYIKIQHLGTTITISDVFLFTTKSYMKEVRKVCDMRSLCVSECLTPPGILAGAGGHQKFFQVDLNQDYPWFRLINQLGRAPFNENQKRLASIRARTAPKCSATLFKKRRM